MQKAQQMLKIREVFLDIVTIFLVFVLVFAFLFDLRLVTVYKNSMAPTLADGSVHIVRLIDDTESLPAVGSIVTFYTNEGKHYCKRLIGYAGDKINYTDGCLYVNGVFFDNLPGTGIHGFDEFDWEITVDYGCFFALGDNRLISLDSRDLGCFPYDGLEGEIIF